MTTDCKNETNSGELTRFDFGALVSAIQLADEYLAVQAGKAVNVSLTLRNWLIGLYIAEFELRGLDRATYGDNLLDELSKELRHQNISSTGRRQLYNYLSFYRSYPQIVRTVSAQYHQLIPDQVTSSEKVRTPSAQLVTAPEKLLNKLSYSHFELLIGLDDDLKRSFYEIQCICGNWSVRELKRQIGSLYYERSGLSWDKDKLADLTQASADLNETRLAIRDPYVFEFLGVKSREVMRESDLEEALLDRLQDFLLELGHGFCFEALGQLNTYVNWYRKNMMMDGDNPPIGLLLCTHKDQALVEYALAGIDNNLFISKYQLELPKKEEIRRFLKEKMHDVNSQGGKTC